MEVSKEAFLWEAINLLLDIVGQLLVEVVEETKTGTENPLLGSLGQFDVVEYVLLVNCLLAEYFDSVVGL